VAEQAYAYVTLIPVAKGFQSAVAKEMGGVGGIGAKAGQDAGGKFKSSFGGALKGIAALAGTALAGIGISKFFGDAVEQSSRLGESLNAVSVAYGNASSEIAKLGEDAATRLGVSQATFNEAAVRFSAFSQRVVGEGGNQAKFLDDITTRATDFASVYNIEVAEALQVFQSGLSGEAEPLKRFGINLLDSEVKAFALANGIGEVGRELTETEKVQARYGLLLESTNKTAGDFANTSDGLANSQRILAANFEDMKASVGEALLPAITNLTQAFVPLVERIGVRLSMALEDMAPLILNVADKFEWLIGLLPSAVSIFMGLADIFLQIVDLLLPPFTALLDYVAFIMEELTPIISEVLSEAFVPLAEMFAMLISQLWPLVEGGLLDLFVQVIRELAPVVIQLAQALIPLVELLLPILIGLLEFIIPIAIVIADIFSSLLVRAIEQFAGALEYGLNFVKMFADEFGLTFSALQDFFYKIINGMIAGFEGFVNTTIDALNSVIRALNSIRVTAPDWVTKLTGMTSFGLSLSELNKTYFRRLSMSAPVAPTFMAKGGFVDSPTSAIIGEAGPEVVMPLDRFESMMGLGQKDQQPINYYAAPNKSLDAEQELLLAMRRVRVFS